MVYIVDKFSPKYNINSAALAKWRKRPLKDMDRTQIEAYGAAVLDAIGKANKALLKRSLEPGWACPCASGTYASDPNEIFAAIRRQKLAKLHAPGPMLSIEQWKMKYAAAMAAKSSQPENEP